MLTFWARTGNRWTTAAHLLKAETGVNTAGTLVARVVTLPAAESLSSEVDSVPFSTLVSSSFPSSDGIFSPSLDSAGFSSSDINSSSCTSRFQLNFAGILFGKNDSWYNIPHQSKFFLSRCHLAYVTCQGKNGPIWSYTLEEKILIPTFQRFQNPEPHSENCIGSSDNGYYFAIFIAPLGGPKGTDVKR